jgi:hypothetical protein
VCWKVKEYAKHMTARDGIGFIALDNGLATEFHTRDGTT